MLALVAACLAAARSAPAEIVRRSVSRDQDNGKLARNYTFIQRIEERKLGKTGNVQEVESRTVEVLILYGRPYERLIALDGKPPDAAREKKEEEKLAKETARRKREFDSATSRRKREAEFETNRERRRRFLLEAPDAFDFRLAGEELSGGRRCWVIDAALKHGYRPRDSRAGKLLTKFRGRLWIDREEYPWVRAEAETIGTVSFVWFLARLGEGARVIFEQEKINGGIWLPRASRIRFDARLGLVKSVRREVDLTFRDYRKFQAESRVVSTSEAPVP